MMRSRLYALLTACTAVALGVFGYSAQDGAAAATPVAFAATEAASAAQCDAPAEAPKDRVYFVTCGGFF